MKKKKKPNKYMIDVYSGDFKDERRHVFYSKTKRAVVGLMKTVMDNFDPNLVEVCDLKRWKERMKKKK